MPTQDQSPVLFLILELFSTSEGPRRVMGQGCLSQTLPSWRGVVQYLFSLGALLAHRVPMSLLVKCLSFQEEVSPSSPSLLPATSEGSSRAAGSGARPGFAHAGDGTSG